MPVVCTQLRNLIKIAKVCKVSSCEPRDKLRRSLGLQQSAPVCCLTDGCVTMLSGIQGCELSDLAPIL